MEASSLLVLSVSVAGILVTSLLMLAYYLFLLCSCRLRHSHPAPANATAAAHLHSRRGGLEEAAIRRIPTLRYQQKQQQQQQHCAVCLADFREGERLRRLPLCLHSFHIDCIDAWLCSAATCPLCRAPVAASSLAASTIAVVTSPRPPTMSMRRSLSMDSSTHKQLYLAVLQQQHSAPLGCQDGKSEESTVAGAVSGRPLRRSFFSFSHGRSSPSPILPI